MRKIISGLKRSEDRRNILIIFAATFCILFILFRKGYVMGHDTPFHAANILALSKTISLSSPFGEKIVGDVAYGLGYGTYLFYPKLPHLITAYILLIISPFTSNVLYAMKIVIFLNMIFSGMAMYLLSERIFRKKNYALVSALMYMVCPYHLSNIFNRDAFAETFLFSVLPFIFVALFELLEGNYRRYVLLFSVSFAIGMYSHLISMVFVTGFVIIFLLCFADRIFNKRTILALFVSAFFVLCFTAPYTMSMIEMKLTGNYVVFDGVSMAPYALVGGNRLPISVFFKGTSGVQNGVWVGMNAVVWISVLLSVVFGRKCLNGIQKRLVWVFFGLSGFILVFMSDMTPWNLLPEFLWMIQFPWRLCSILCVFTCVIAPLWLDRVNFSKSYIALISVLAISCVFYPMPLHSNGNLASIAGTMNVSGMGTQKEYLPVNCREFMESESFEDWHSNAIILEDTTDSLVFSSADTEYIELPRIYYPGYSVIDENEREYPVSMSENGLVSVTIEYGGKYTLRYTGTMVQKVSYVIFLGGILLYLTYWKRSKKRTVRG